MPKYNLKITVTEVRGGGKCEMGIKAGDSWLVEEDRAPFCTWAYSAIFPFMGVVKNVIFPVCHPEAKPSTVRYWAKPKDPDLHRDSSRSLP